MTILIFMLILRKSLWISFCKSIFDLQKSVHGQPWTMFWLARKRWRDIVQGCPRTLSLECINGNQRFYKIWHFYRLIVMTINKCENCLMLINKYCFLCQSLCKEELKVLLNSLKALLFVLISYCITSDVYIV